MSKKQLKGIVVSDKMAKTVVVDVARITQHPKYKKRFQVNKRYKAHVEGDMPKVGEKVVIEETRPLSKHKRWQVIDVIGGTVKSEDKEKL